MGEQTIENIEDLIRQYDPSKQLVDYKIKNMTVPGENYAGVMIRVDATLKGDGQEETIHAVAKTPNFTVHEFFRNHIPAQYKKEIGFYREIVPILQKFYKEESGEELPDIFPKMYAGRFNLTGDPDVVDQYAVILLENLVEAGYKNIDRHVGFNLEDAKLILKDIATFHAVPIALKLKQPAVFETKIQQPAQVKMDHKRPQGGKDQPRPRDVWVDLITEYDDATPYLKEVTALLEAGFQGIPTPKEPFATAGHRDLWTNNTMQVVQNGKVVKNKLIDFQMLCYESPIKDMMFFLCTSLQLDLLEDRIDELIRHYHQHFVGILKKCNCDTSMFEWDGFKKELDSEAPVELAHIIRMMAPVMGKKGEPVFDTREAPVLKPEKVTDFAKRRVAKVINVFGRRGWL